MRLLAHGGTRYSERHRIGEWSAIPREVLESTYGIPGDSMTYGLGILKDCLPFLIVRVRQITSIGRAYAYTLLLDPDRHIWERFGWNAAALLRTILSRPMSDSLLSEPETLKAEDLVDEFSQLYPASADLASGQSLGNSSEPIARWIGAQFSDEPVVLTPQALGFTTRPSPDELASLVTSIPQPCFRAGGGWLIGGSREHAQSLGARLVLDDGLDLAAPDAADTERGRDAIHAWTTISDSEASVVLKELESVPMCEWKDTEGASASQLLGRLQVLTQMLGTEQPPDLLFQGIEQQLQGFPFLTAEIRQAAHRRVFRSGQTLSGVQTALALHNFYAQGLDIPAEAIQRLDRETLVQTVVEHGTESPVTSTSLALPDEAAVDVLVRRLGAKSGYREIPQRVLQASKFILESLSAAHRQKWLAQLVNAVEIRTKVTDESLLAWESFPPHHPLWPAIAEILESEVRRRAKFRRTGWELEYLLFGRDAGGAELSRDGVEKHEASQLISFYLKQLRDRTILAPAAGEWLKKLAGSPLRDSISIADKVAIAESNISSNWLPFLTLWYAYSDAGEPKQWDSALAYRLCTDKEREQLRLELTQMLREYPPRTRFPDLPRLQKLLVNISDDFIKTLAGHQRHRMGTVAFRRWIEGLRALKQAELAAKETVQFCLGCSQPLPEGWLFPRFDEKQLEDLVDCLLFRGFSNDDTAYRNRCEDVLSSRPLSNRLQKTFARVCKGGLTETHRRENFIRRYGEYEPALSRILDCFTKSGRQYVVGQLAFHDEPAFVKLVHRIIEEVEHGVYPNTYHYTVLKYVRHADAKLTKKILRWTLVGKDELKTWLDRVLQTSAEAEEPTEELIVEEPETLLQTATAGPPITTAIGERAASGKRHSSPHDHQDQKELDDARPGLGRRVRSFFGFLNEEPLPEEEYDSAPGEEEEKRR